MTINTLSYESTLQTLSPFVISVRAQSDLTPKRITTGKTVSSIMRELLSSAETDFPQEKLHLHFFSSGVDRDIVKGLLSFGYNVALHPHFNSLLALQNVLSVKDKLAAYIVFGDSQVNGLESHAPLAKSLLHTMPNLEDEFLAGLLQFEKGRSIKYDEFVKHDLLVQEKFGRFQILNLMRDANRKATKSIQAYLQRSNQNRDPFVCQNGWGIGGILLSDESKPSFRKSKIKAKEILFKNRYFDLEVCRDIQEILSEMIKSEGVNTERRFYISCPYPSVGAYLWFKILVPLFNNLPVFNCHYPDLLFGWYPVLNFLEFVGTAPRGSVYIGTSSFPRVVVATIGES